MFSMRLRPLLSRWARSPLSGIRNDRDGLCDSLPVPMLCREQQRFFGHHNSNSNYTHDNSYQYHHQHNPRGVVGSTQNKNSSAAKGSAGPSFLPPPPAPAPAQNQFAGGSPALTRRGLQGTPPVAWERGRLNNSHAHYKYVFRTFAPFDYQIGHDCVSESDRLLSDAKHVMPLILPVSRLLMTSARRRHAVQLQQQQGNASNAGGNSGSGSGTPMLSVGRAAPKIPVSTMNDVFADAGLNFFTLHCASKFINRYFGPLDGEAQQQLSPSPSSAGAEDNQQQRNDAHNNTINDKATAHHRHAQQRFPRELRPFDVSDAQRPNQVKLIRKLMKWLAEGVESGIVEVHTLLHEYEDLENVFATRPVVYQGSFKDASELVPIRKYFVSFLNFIVARLDIINETLPRRVRTQEDEGPTAGAGGGSQQYHMRGGAPANSQPRTLTELQKEEAKLFLLQCRCLIANLFLRIDPLHYTTNRYECGVLGLMEDKTHRVSTAGGESRVELLGRLTDVFAFTRAGPAVMGASGHSRNHTSSNSNNNSGNSSGGGGFRRGPPQPSAPAGALGTPFCGNSRFIPPMLRAHSFVDFSPDYDVYRLSRFLSCSRYKTFHQAMRDGAMSGSVLQNPIVDVAMTAPQLVEMWRPPFAELAEALGSHPLTREWLLLGSTRPPAPSPQQQQQQQQSPPPVLSSPLSPFDPRLVSAVVKATDADPMLAESMVALMCVPPQLLKGLLMEGKGYLAGCEAYVGGLISELRGLPTVTPAPPAAASSSSANANGSAPNHHPQDQQEQQQQQRAEHPPLMGGIRFKLHPAFRPPLMSQAERAEAIAHIASEDMRLGAIPHRDRKVKESRAVEDLRRVVQRSAYPDNVYNDVGVLAYGMFDAMPDHPIDIRFLKRILPVEAQCGITLDRKIIARFPNLFTDVTPVGWQRIQFQRADVGGDHVRDYTAASNDELALTFIQAVKERRDIVADHPAKLETGHEVYSSMRVSATAGKRFMTAVLKRFGSYEAFFQSFPQHFVLIGRVTTEHSGEDVLFQMPQRTFQWLPMH